MRISTSMRWLVVAVSAAMLLAVAAACSSETIEVPGETVVVEKEVIKTVEVPGETVVKEVIKEVQVPGETVVVKEEVVKEVMVPGETVVVEKVVTETVEVPGETVTVEVVKEVMVPGETVVVEKEVVKTVEVPGQTVVVEKEVVKTVEVPGETVVKEVVKTVEVPGQTVVVEKEVVKTVEVPGKTVVVEKEVLKVVEVRQGYVTDPTTGKVVSAPQYGGTLTPALCYEPQGVDSTVGGAQDLASGVVEKLGQGDWGINRDVYGFVIPFDSIPEVAMKGSLAESWDISPDERTYTFHIRKGVYWHNKAPMNGRELTAYDVEYNYHRLTGTGSGFTEPTPKQANLNALSFESITATDKGTLVIKLKEPYFGALGILTDDSHIFIFPPEVIQEHGDANDWRNLVGTGPYMLTDLVDGSSITYEKNPDYWGYDEKYPENRLPYIDQIEVPLILDPATSLAAMRTGKIDALFGSIGCTSSLDDLESLQRTNPEVVAWPYYQRSNYGFTLNVTEPPFDDIRVRHAMQMALDIETISNAFWKGYANITPQGNLSNALTEWTTPFEEWPEELQGYYTYDPAGAEALLDAAGYTRGADGIRFKTNMDALDAILFVDYYLAAADYLAKIGVEVDVQVTGLAEYGAWAARFENQGYGGMGFAALAQVGCPLCRMTEFHSTLGRNMPGVNDPAYDALVDAATAATTLEELQRLVNEADMRLIEQHWHVWGPMSPELNVQQPWVTGYTGEVQIGTHNRAGVLWTRLWIDSELKEAMGY